jgi:PPOX class probable F420-dependent enzyme
VVVRLATDEARTRFATARVARLATVGEDGAPHLVPVVFAVVGNTIVHVVDAKPKSTNDPRRLTRIRNLQRDPRVAFLADAYDEDWSALWWVRADALASTLDRAADADEWDRAVVALATRYPQYDTVRPTGPVITARVTRWTGWSATG